MDGWESRKERKLLCIKNDLFKNKVRRNQGRAVSESCLSGLKAGQKFKITEGQIIMVFPNFNLVPSIKVYTNKHKEWGNKEKKIRELGSQRNWEPVFYSKHFCSDSLWLC